MNIGQVQQDCMRTLCQVILGHYFLQQGHTAPQRESGLIHRLPTMPGSVGQSHFDLIDQHQRVEEAAQDIKGPLFCQKSGEQRARNGCRYQERRISGRKEKTQQRRYDVYLENMSIFRYLDLQERRKRGKKRVPHWQTTGFPLLLMMFFIPELSQQ